MKQIKPELPSHTRNGTYAAGIENSARHQTPEELDEEMGLDELPQAPIAAAMHDTVEWQNAIESVVRSVVSIHFCQTCSFDTDPAVASEATGFVVDAERGYILTNRVCTAGQKLCHCKLTLG
jgi:S1-C subfamily serine protease